MNMIKKLLAALAISAGMLALSGCASESTIEESSVERGQSQSFSASIESVEAAAIATLSDLGLNLKNTTRAADGVVTLVFSKPVSAFSWGEVGKIVISGSPSTTVVTVVSSKRVAFQITGTTQVTFSEQVFSGISNHL